MLFIAVLDQEPEYSVRLADYIGRKQNSAFTVCAFTDAALLEERADKQEIDLLLVSENVLTDRIRELKNIRQIVILTEERTGAIKAEFPAVYKYQPSDGVVKEALACYAAQNQEALLGLHVMKHAAGLTGVYSPVKRCLKTTFAVIYGWMQAREGRTLLISFDTFSDFSRLFQRSFSYDLADILYYYRNDSCWYEQAAHMLESIDGLDIIAPCACPEDIWELKAEDIGEFVRQMAVYGGYESVVLDIGEDFREPVRLLEQCGRIYMPEREDEVSAAKMQSYQSYLAARKLTALEDRTVRLRFPRLKRSEGRGCWFEQVMWSNVGGYIRDVLQDGGRSG